MVLRAAILLMLMILPAHSASRGTMIAMAVALLDVAEEHCIGQIAIDQTKRKELYLHFHEYDIGGLASAISLPLNSFYEEFAAEACAERDRFCKAAPAQSARTGYPVITALGD
jgi:hypothetical protein